jgi:hypothetical protein
MAVVMIAALGIVARLISSYFDFNFGLVLLGSVLAAYAALSIIVAVKRSRLAAQLKHLSAAERRALGDIYPELRYLTATPQGNLSARAATWIGVIAINGPIVPIMVGPLFVGTQVFGSHIPLLAGAGLLLLGFVLASAWWSVMVTFWRQWATRRGVDPDELQWRGERATLLWPRGHLLEKAELGQLLKLAAKRRGG